MSKLVNTRNGVFANEGHGGGVFNYNVAFGSDTPTAAVGRRGVGVLQSGEDPSYPWKAFGFQTMALQSTMNDNLPDFGKCKITADGNMGPITCGALDFLMSKGMPFAPNGTCEAMRGSESFRAPANPPCLTTGLPLTPRDDPFHWKQFSSETQRLQAAINTHLSAMERCPITVDGKLGPATCGALAVVKDAGRGGDLEIPIDCDVQREPHVFPGDCPANTPAPPPPVNTPAPPPPVEEEEVAPEPDKKGGMNALLVLGILAAAATGLVLATKKKKK